MQLRLTLKKQWYSEIQNGTKTEEYREIKPYWSKRLWDKRNIITSVLFVNGYSKDAPKMEFYYLGCYLKEHKGKTVFAIKIGKRKN